MTRCSRNSITRSKNERRLFIGQELDEANDFGGLTFNIPFDRVSMTPTTESINPAPLQPGLGARVQP